MLQGMRYFMRTSESARRVYAGMLCQLLRDVRSSLREIQNRRIYADLRTKPVVSALSALSVEKGSSRTLFCAYFAFPLIRSLLQNEWSPSDE